MMDTLSLTKNTEMGFSASASEDLARGTIFGVQVRVSTGEPWPR